MMGTTTRNRIRRVRLFEQRGPFGHLPRLAARPSLITAPSPLTVALIRERLTAPHALRLTGLAPEMFARVSSIGDATRQPRENAPIPSHHSEKSWASCPRGCQPARVICPEGSARAQDRGGGSRRAEGRNVPPARDAGGMDG